MSSSDSRKAQLIQALEDAPSPTISGLESTEFSYSDYYEEFGGIKGARRVAGLNGSETGPSPASKSELLEALADFAAKLGKAPTSAEMDDFGPYSSQIYLDRFNGWNDALREAGLELNALYSSPGFSLETGSTSHLRMRLRRLVPGPTWRKAKRNSARDGGRCEVCGFDGPIHLHHIIPLCAGGTNEEWNLMSLCASCHAKADHKTRTVVEPVIVSALTRGGGN